jgi:outer membrane protein
MKKRMLSTLALVGFMVFPLSGFAEKIGFVNVTRLFNEYAQVQGIDNMIEQRFSAPKQEIEKLVTDIKALEKEIKTNELMMTESKLSASKARLQKMVGEYREKGMQLEKELQEVRNAEMGKFRQVVFDVIKQYAEEKNYDLIVNEGVMYAKDEINITEDILQRVNKAAK